MTARFTPPEDLSRYAGFIFDCDGTLADTMPAHFIAWKEALREGGANFDFTWELFVSRAGMSMEGTVRELSAQFDVELDADLIAKRQREIYHRESGSIGPIAEVVEFARSLAGKYPLAVASGSSRPNVERALESIHVREIFDVVVTPEDVSRGKPDPEMFLLAARKLEVDPTRCLVLEDGELGFQAARAAGMGLSIVKCEKPETA